MEDKNEAPVISPTVSLPEITFRGMLLGTLLTIILASANAYLGLKVGLTVSASIPAAVIAMGVLRIFRDTNILENTMVQTMASVGEALTAGIAYILPALIILGTWERFNYWQTVAISIIGGFLGVLFTIPLRRALLQDKSLRYPEGVAIGNVLKASVRRDQADLSLMVTGGVVGAVIALFQSGLQILADNYAYWFKASGKIFGFGLGLSPALIAAGYIVGINVAISMFIGIVVGWVMGVPILSSIYSYPETLTATKAALFLWREHIRYIGVGTMLVGGLWTMCTLIKPVSSSIAASLVSLRQLKRGQIEKPIRTEQDIPIHYVLLGLMILSVPIFLMINFAIIPANLPISTPFKYFISGFSTFYVLVSGFIFCSVMAYFAGLIGSSNSPVSGMSVSALLVLCLIFVGLFSTQRGLAENKSVEMIGAAVAIGSLVAICAALAIANDTMQDLKVGEMVGATPWKQQAMLFAGVLVAAFVIPPILQLLYNAYGIGGVFPRPNMNPAHMLAAPQAGLMATIAKGAFSHQLEWPMLYVGSGFAVICIIVDEILKRYGTRLPVLAVGIGIYLPLDSSVPIVIGGILAHLINVKLTHRYSRNPGSALLTINAHRHRGLLLACGLVAGASIMSVILAFPFAIYQSSDVLKIMPEQYSSCSGILGVIVIAILCAWIYKVVMRRL